MIDELYIAPIRVNCQLRKQKAEKINGFTMDGYKVFSLPSLYVHKRNQRQREFKCMGL